MPHAKIDVAFIRDHFAAVPERDRPRTIALYLELVLTSAELLLDGQVPQHVALVCAHKIGISRSRYGRSEVSKIVALLEDAGLVRVSRNSTSRAAERNESSTSRSAPERREVLQNLHSRTRSEPSEVSQSGDLALVYWSAHHNSRDYVDDRRKQDAERKRGKRQQPTIPGMGTDVRSGFRGVSAADGAADLARGGARTRSASESENFSSSSSVARPERPDDDELRVELEELGVNGHVLLDVRHDPERAWAWLAYTAAKANGNRAGYFATGFATGGWPPELPAAETAGEKRERYVRKTGYRLPDDELEYQLVEKGAGPDEVVGLTELAADLRAGSVT